MEVVRAAVARAVVVRAAVREEEAMVVATAVAMEVAGTEAGTAVD
jgi:hypothetical protein